MDFSEYLLDDENDLIKKSSKSNNFSESLFNEILEERKLHKLPLVNFNNDTYNRYITYFNDFNENKKITSNSFKNFLQHYGGEKINESTFKYIVGSLRISLKESLFEGKADIYIDFSRWFILYCKNGIEFTEQNKINILTDIEYQKLITECDKKVSLIIQFIYNTAIDVNNLEELSLNNFSVIKNFVYLEIKKEGKSIKASFDKALFEEIVKTFDSKTYFFESRKGEGLNRKSIWRMINSESKRVIGRDDIGPKSIISYRLNKEKAKSLNLKNLDEYRNVSEKEKERFKKKRPNKIIKEEIKYDLLEENKGIDIYSNTIYGLTEICREAMGLDEWSDKFKLSLLTLPDNNNIKHLVKKYFVTEKGPKTLNSIIDYLNSIKDEIPYNSYNPTKLILKNAFINTFKFESNNYLFLGYVEKKLSEINPLEIKSKRLQEEKLLTENEVLDYLKQTSYKTKLLAIFILNTAVKTGEIGKILLDDCIVDKENVSIKIISSKTNSTRKIYIDANFYNKLLKYYSCEKYLFCSHYGNPLFKRSINEILKRDVDDILRKKINATNLRHFSIRKRLSNRKGGIESFFKEFGIGIETGSILYLTDEIFPFEVET